MVLPLLLLVSVWASLLTSGASAGHYTNEWAAHIQGGDEEAHRVAAELNCVVKGRDLLLQGEEKNIFMSHKFSML